MMAIENDDINTFKSLGGHSTADLNFPVSKDGLTPLMIAAAKGQ